MKNKWFYIKGLADNGSVLSFPFDCHVHSDNMENAGKKAMSYSNSFYRKVWRINSIVESENPHNEYTNILNRLNKIDERIIIE
jgi:hypothetical protein